MGKTVAIHTNLRLDHQREYADYLKSGFERHGLQATVTAEKNCDADIHVVQGPHYALKQNIGQVTIFLDRCYWGHPRKNVSLSWLTEDGKKVWLEDAPGDRFRPEVRPWKKDEARIIVLNDYERHVDMSLVRGRFDDVEVRHHPAVAKPVGSLRDAFSRNDIAIGYTSTALVSAAISGLPVICLDDGSPVAQIASTLDDICRPDRTQWLNNLSYMNWSYVEIENGEALEQLLCQSPY